MRGHFQRAVLVVLQHLEDIALPAQLRQLAVARQRFIFCVFQLLLQGIDLDDILLAGISVSDIYHNEESDEHAEPDLPPHERCAQDIATENLPQRESSRLGCLVFRGLLADHFGERLVYLLGLSFDVGSDLLLLFFDLFLFIFYCFLFFFLGSIVFPLF